MERNRNKGEERLRRRIKKLERENADQYVDILLYKADNRERRERRAIKYKNNFKTDVAAPFTTLRDDDVVNRTEEGAKILTRLANSNPVFDQIIRKNWDKFFFSAYTNGTIVIVTSYATATEEGFGVAIRNQVDEDNAATGTLIALRRSLQDLLGKSIG